VGSGPGGPPISNGSRGPGAAGAARPADGSEGTEGIFGFGGAEIELSAPASEAFCIPPGFCQNPAPGTITNLWKNNAHRMRNALTAIAIEHLGIVRIRGAEAVKFLQGQLSNDVAQLRAERSLLAGYHNPQGRTIALIRLVQWDTDDILAVVPRELATVVASRLAKFVLRAKVKVADESVAWRVSGLVATADVAAGAGLPTSDAAAVAASAAAAAGPVGVSPAAAAATIVAAASVAEASGSAASGTDADRAEDARPGLASGALRSLELPASIGAQVRGDGAAYVCVGDQTPRWLVISPADGPSPVLDYSIADGATWQRLEVAAGQPQVYAATSEEFVAQMLNLDALNAIAFDKGCYTGQEVIARAHYRGRVKRRMQRFVSREACRLSPGDSGQLADGRTFKVVQAAQLPDGRCDFLAVAPLVGALAEPGDATSKLASDARPIMDPTTAPIAVATVAPTVAAAAALSAAAAPSRPGSPANDPPAVGAPVSPTLPADQATLPYPLPD
jgi:tRNA-modifying protein YgfZ